MRTLQLTTTNTRSFFNKQVEFLERGGISCDVVALAPGKYQYDEFVNQLGSLGRVMPEFGYSLRFAGLNITVSYPHLLAKTTLNDYDLIHANGGLCAPFATLQPKRPVVQTFWGSDLMGSYALGQYDKICKLTARHFDASIVRNKTMQEELRGHTDAHIIPAGVDLEMFRPIDANDARETLHWSHDVHHVLFPYRPWTGRKNFDVAEKVVYTAREELAEPVYLQVVHDMPFDDMPYYYNAADALILASDLEGSPNTVKEAMACNTPVVATDVGDVSELLANVDVSTVVDTPAESNVDELAQGVIDAIEADGHADSRTEVEHLSWDRVSDQIVDVYETVV